MMTFSRLLFDLILFKRTCIKSRMSSARSDDLLRSYTWIFYLVLGAAKIGQTLDAFII